MNVLGNAIGTRDVIYFAPKKKYEIIEDLWEYIRKGMNLWGALFRTGWNQYSVSAVDLGNGEKLWLDISLDSVCFYGTKEVLEQYSKKIKTLLADLKEVKELPHPLKESNLPDKQQKTKKERTRTRKEYGA